MKSNEIKRNQKFFFLANITFNPLFKISLLVLILFFYNLGYGQGYSVKVESYGTVRIYNSTVMQSGLTIWGTLSGQSLIQSNNILPFNNNSGTVGNSNKAFGSVWSYGIYNLSDSRQKENIRGINNALSTVTQLTGYKYDIKKEYSSSDSLISKSRKELDRKDKIGFLAQDVYAVLPEVVYHDDSTDVYAINYISIIPVLVEAIKELASELDDYKKNSNLKSTSINEVFNDGIPFLKQNTPNPFNVKSKIEMYIPSESSLSVLYIYNLQGNQIKAIDINQKGDTFIEIEARFLKPGMYLYSLVVDGKIIDTKRMIITN
jgi:hypothetical protein